MYTCNCIYDIQASSKCHSVSQVLVEVCSVEVIEEVMMPVVTKMAEDAVPNVRFNVAKSLTKITSRVGQGSVAVV